MTSLDFLYYSLGFGSIVLVGFVSYTLYEVSLTLKSLRRTLNHVDNIVDNIDDFTTEISLLKDKVKVGSFSIISKILKLMFNKNRREGGE